MKSSFVNVGIAVLLSCAGAVAQEKSTFSIDSAKSKIEINVYKEGLFKALAHNHLVAAKQIFGAVQFVPQKIENSSVNLKVDTKSLIVQPEGESEKDLPEIQATMSGEKVLNVTKYPEAEFTSTGVSGVKPSGDGWTLTLSGNLKLHGVEKPITLPLTLHVRGAEIEAQGEAPLLQTDYGITPIKVGGGAVTVKNQLKISFDIIAEKMTP